MKRILALALMLGLTGSAFAVPRGWTTDFESARDTALKNGKSVFVAVLDTDLSYASRTWKSNTVDTEEWSDWQSDSANISFVWCNRAEMATKKWDAVAYLFSQSPAIPFVFLITPDGKAARPDSMSDVAESSDLTAWIEDVLDPWADVPAGTLVWPTASQIASIQRWTLNYDGARDAGYNAGLPVLLAIVDSDQPSAGAGWARGVLMSDEWKEWLATTKMYLVLWDRAKISRTQWDKVAFQFAGGDSITLPQMVLFGPDGLKVDQIRAVNSSGSTGSNTSTGDDDDDDDLDDDEDLDDEDDDTDTYQPAGNFALAPDFIAWLDDYISEWDGVQTGPGTIGFTSSSMTVTSGVAVATVTVRRSGGSSEGTQTVQVQTHDGSATNGIHYTAVSTTLTWANGVSGDRTFDIPLLTDGELWQLNESAFTVTLKGVGATASLGRTNQTITIVSNFTSPTNWTYDAASGKLSSPTLTTGQTDVVTWAAPQAGLLSFRGEVTGTAGRLEVDVPGASPATNTLVLTYANSLTEVASQTNATVSLSLPTLPSDSIRGAELSLPLLELPFGSVTGTTMALPFPVRPDRGAGETLTLSLPPDTTSVFDSAVITPIMYGEMLATSILFNATLEVPSALAPAIAETNVVLEGLGGARSDADATVNVLLESTDAGLNAVTTIMLSGEEGDVVRAFTNTVSDASALNHTVPLTLTNGPASASCTTTWGMSGGSVTVTGAVTMTAPNDATISEITETVALSVSNNTTSATADYDVTLALTNDEVTVTVALWDSRRFSTVGLLEGFSTTIPLDGDRGSATATGIATLTVTDGVPMVDFHGTLTIPNAAATQSDSNTLSLAVTNGALIAESSHTVELVVTNNAAWVVATSQLGSETAEETIALANLSMTTVDSTNVTYAVTNDLAIAVHTVVLSASGGIVSAVTSQAELDFLDEQRTGSQTTNVTLTVTNGVLVAESSNTVTLVVASDRALVVAITAVESTETGALVSITNNVNLETGTAGNTNVTFVVTNGTAVAGHTVALAIDNGEASVVSDASLIFFQVERVGTETNVTLAVTNDVLSAESSNTVALMVSNDMAWVVSTITLDSSETGESMSVTNNVSLDATADSTTVTWAVTNGTVAASHTVTLAIDNGVAVTGYDAELTILQMEQVSTNLAMTLTADSGAIAATSDHDVTLVVSNGAAWAVAVSTVGDTAITNTVELGVAETATDSATLMMTYGTVNLGHTLTLTVDNNGVASAGLIATLQVANSNGLATASNTVAVVAGAQIVWRASGSGSTAALYLLDWAPFSAAVPISPASGVRFATTDVPTLFWSAPANGTAVLHYGTTTSMTNAITNAVSGVDASDLGLTDGVCYWRVDSVATGDFSTEVMAQGGTRSFEVTDAPSYSALALSASAYLDVPVTFSVAATESVAAVTYSVSGLPAGLGINASTGEVSGTPTKAGSFSATVTARSAKGVTSLPLTVTVQKVTAVLSGSFQGVLTDTDGVVRGTVTVTVSSRGVPSAKVMVNGKSVTLKGTWTSGAGGALAAQFSGRTGGTLTLSLAANSGAGRYGDLAVSAGRVMSKTEVAGYVGAYTAILDARGADENVPEGYGYMTLNVAKTGSVKYSGKLADGTSVSGSSKLMVGAQAGTATFPLYKALYSRRGEVSAQITLGQGAPRMVTFAGGGWSYPGKGAQVYGVFDAALLGYGSAYVKPTDFAGYDGLGLDTGDGAAERTLHVVKRKLAVAEGDVKLSVKAATGLFTGRFPDTTGKSRSFKGVLVSTPASGAGYWLSPDADAPIRVNRSAPVVIGGVP